MMTQEVVGGRAGGNEGGQVPCFVSSFQLMRFRPELLLSEQ
jgi:hypothetical protein